MARSKQSESNPEATRYDVNRTLSTYRPVNTAPVGGVAAPQYMEGTEDTATTPLESPKTKKRFSVKKALFVLVAAVLIPTIILATWNYRNAAGAAEKLFGSSNVLGALLPTQLSAENG